MTNSTQKSRNRRHRNSEAVENWKIADFPIPHPQTDFSLWESA